MHITWICRYILKLHINSSHKKITVYIYVVFTRHMCDFFFILLTGIIQADCRPTVNTQFKPSVFCNAFQLI